VERVAGEIIQTREHLALEVLKHWEDIPGGSSLMPEYFETRSLFCNERPGEQVLRIRCLLFTCFGLIFVSAAEVASIYTGGEAHCLRFTPWGNFTTKGGYCTANSDYSVP